MLKIINVILLLASLIFSTCVYSNDNQNIELNKAINIVKTFMSYEDNVDTFENYWLVAKEVANIAPVNSKRKVDFLIMVCNSYTPTDKNGAHSLACDKIWYLGHKIAPKVDPKTYHSSQSPLYKLVK